MNMLSLSPEDSTLPDDNRQARFAKSRCLRASDKSHAQYAGASGPPRRLRARLRINGLRWCILALIFLVTCINYIDRSSIGLLFTHFGPELGIRAQQYGWIGAILLFAYTVSQSVSGRLYDRFGARIGFTVSIVVWCARRDGALGHHSASPALPLLLLSRPRRSRQLARRRKGRRRMVSAKRTSHRHGHLQRRRLHGCRDRASAGRRLLDPLIGWRKTFLVVGSLGFFWLVAWLHHLPARSIRIHGSRKKSAATSCEGQPQTCSEALAFAALSASYRQTWGICWRASSSIPSGGSTCCGCRLI